MSLDLDHAPTRAAHDALSGYLRANLERAAAHAHRLHADEITVEHFLTPILEDEESAACETILFGFADPESMAAETLALSPGILVVGSDSSLPFSPLGVRGLYAARLLARGRDAEVDPATLARACAAVLPDDLRAGLPAAVVGEPVDEAEPGQEDAALFASFDADSRRALGRACRAARRNGRRAISPVHVLEACLEPGGALARETGRSWNELRRHFADRDADESAPAPRALAVDGELAVLVERLPGSADSLDVLELLGQREDELGQLLRRHKITRELIGRARGTFADPDPSA